jgi:transcriptional regulator with XRE-family HTH domain
MLQWDPDASSFLAACRDVAVGRRLSNLRHALGQTQRQLAANLNITGPRWANYEVGTSRIPVDIALRLVEKWEVSLDWIYYGNGAIMPKPLLRTIKAAAKEPTRRVGRLSKETK